MNDVKDFKTVRIVFSKTGRAKYISHLDLNRAMIRSVRRAEIPLWYTEGFNRHPYVTFAAPLSLGYEGLRETMDVRLEEDIPMDTLVRRLDAVMPEGLHVYAAAPAVHKPGEVDRAFYRIELGCTTAEMNALLAQETIPVKKRTKKKTIKTIDLKPELTSVPLKVCDTDTGCRMEIILPCNSTESLNPALIQQALLDFLGRETLSFTVTRLDVFDQQGKSFS